MYSNRVLGKLFLSLIAGVTLFYFHWNSECDNISRKLPNLDQDEPLSSKLTGKNVFLVETKVDTEHVKVTPRLACAIESAARVNYGRNVYLLYASSERLKRVQLTPIVKAIFSYPNVFFNFINITNLSLGSPMEQFIRSEKLAASNYPIEHLADAMRLLVLWKYGGTYIDGDVIVKRSFESVPPNFICRQDAEFANGVLGFNHEQDGLELLETLMEEYATTYIPWGFAANGPSLVTRVIKKLCGETNIDKIMQMKSCKNFNFLKIEECYSVGYPEWQKFVSYDAGQAIEVMRRVNESLVVHFWNHLSKHNILETDSIAAYIELARLFCPRVLEASGDYF